MSVTGQLPPEIEFWLSVSFLSVYLAGYATSEILNYLDRRDKQKAEEEDELDTKLTTALVDPTFIDRAITAEATANDTPDWTHPRHAYCRPVFITHGISAEEFDPEWQTANLTYQKPSRRSLTLLVMYLTTERWNTPKWRLIRRHNLQKRIDDTVRTAIINGYFDISTVLVDV